jgi:argininosuccinate lyase
MSLWAARTGGERLAPEVAEFLRGDDAELLPYDCEGTLVHARRLRDAGILTEAELSEVEAGLARIREDGEASPTSAEDVHTAIELALGPVGQKIHAGRSRNDQVVTALRLYVVDACREAVASIEAFAGALLDRADAEADTLMPGYTHLQRAQPVTLGHHLLAWVEMLDRDRSRLRFAEQQAAPMPLGAGALAGSTLTLAAPRDQMRNSLDAVADRDFALDYLYAVAVLFTHLSRIGEELCLWATAEFGFVRLPAAAATGSSMMPQKLNPDVAELARGKAGTAIGRLTALLATVKSLPLAYDLDLQEDKPPVFAARRDTLRTLTALATLVRFMEIDRERMASAASDPLLLATDVAEALVRTGVPFREAHEQVAGSIHEGSFRAGGDAAASVAARGAPGPGGVRAAIAEARGRFAPAGL